MASTSGVVDETERKMIHSVFELGDTLVREVMVPRPDVVWVERDTAVDKVLRLALRHGYSRLRAAGGASEQTVSGVAYPQRPGAAPQAEQQDAVLSRRHAARGVRPGQQTDANKLSEEMQRAQATTWRRSVIANELRRHRRRRHDRGHAAEEIVGESPTSTTARSRGRVARLDDGRLPSPGCPSKTCRSSTACSGGRPDRPRSCGQSWRRRSVEVQQPCSPRTRASRSRRRSANITGLHLRAARTRAHVGSRRGSSRRHGDAGDGGKRSERDVECV